MCNAIQALAGFIKSLAAGLWTDESFNARKKLCGQGRFSAFLKAESDEAMGLFVLYFDPKPDAHDYEHSSAVTDFILPDL